MMAIMANLGSSTPIIVADRNDPTKVPANKLVRKSRDFLYRFATGVVVQTQKNKAYFSKAVQKTSEVIYNPVNLKEYAGSALQSEKKKQIVSAGRLMPQKNQKMLLEAFSEVVRRYPEYQLVIYGEGSCRAELKQQAIALGIEKQVLLPGNVTNLHDRIQCAEIFVLSSDYEGMPNALIEAMCLGLPSISTKVSGATDLIIDHENGILTEPADEKELAAAMLELIENPQLAQKLAKEAVKLNEQLELSRILKQWENFINSRI